MSENVLAPRSEFQRNFLASDARIIIAGGAMGCLPAETEFLTPTGWKKFSDYQEGDEVGVVNLDEDNYNNTSLSFETPKRYIKEPCLEMNYIESSRFQMTLSPEHRVVYWRDKNPRFQVISWEELLNRHQASKTKGFWGKFRTSLDGVERKGVDLNEWEIRLQVAVAADGYFPREGAENYCRISISKERKIERLKWICEKGGLSLRYLSREHANHYQNGKIDNYIVHPRVKSKKLSEIFWEANQEQLEIIFEEILYWDGYKVSEGYSTKNKSNSFSTKHKDEADFVQYVGTVCGYTSTISLDKRRDGQYNVYFTKAQSRSFANKDGKAPIKTRPTSDGYKYCFEVSTGFLLVREKERIYVTGNSGKSHIGLMRHLRWVEDPNYRGFCIRKNSTAIMQSGGLFESAVSLYRQYSPDIKIRTRDKQIVFPSGATISFDHYEDDRADDNYQGIEISNAMYDEAAHAKERHIWWLISRLRRRDTSNNSIWLTCNPDPDSYLFKWVEWWLFPEGHPNHGMPDPSKNGKRRYLLRKGDELYWGDTEEEVILKYGNLSLPIDHPMQVKPLSVEAHLGTIYFK